MLACHSFKVKTYKVDQLFYFFTTEFYKPRCIFKDKGNFPPNSRHMQASLRQSSSSTINISSSDMVLSSHVHPSLQSNKKYLFWFSNEHVNFARVEMDALFSMFDMDKALLDKSVWFGPLMVLELPNETQAHQLLSRSVLVHECFEIWCSENSMEDLHSDFKNNLHMVAPYTNSSFRLRIDTYGKKISQELKLELIHAFDYLPLNGTIDLKNPVCSLHLIQFYGIDTNNIPEEPIVALFGRFVGTGQRKLISKISLKSRKFIGNTSMDPLLSLLMSNLGLIRKDNLVFDPFVGTGSLLVVAALMGAFVLGTDIDYLMIHGKSKPSKAFVVRKIHSYLKSKRAPDESVLANLRQYGVGNRYIDVLVADASLPLWREELKFDVIITDPPYGLRESTERIGSEKLHCKVPEEHLDKHYPQKVSYSFCDIFKDLIDFSAQRLRVGGRLVCWIPISRPAYDEKKLPQNSCFKLVANCEQALTTYAGRRLLVYEKVVEPTKDTSETVMNTSEVMYRYKSIDPIAVSRKERKLKAASTFGKSSKRGQLIPTDL